MAPAMLGLMAHYFAVRVMIIIPLFGSIMVFLLIGLIWLEAKLHRLVAQSGGIRRTLRPCDRFSSISIRPASLI